MRRREFIAGLGAVAVLPEWPLAARAQQPGRMRRIGVLLAGAEDDPIFRLNVALLRDGLQKLGWTEGHNLRIDVRSGDVAYAAHAEELARLAPDVIVASGAAQTRAVQQRTQAIPIVFASVGDPVASGVVKSIARPEGNTTGVTNLFPSVAGKWLELLREAVPNVARVALIFNPEFPASEFYMTSIEAAATAIGVTAIRTPVRNAAEIERAIDAIAAEPNGALIAVPPPLASADRLLIATLAVRHRMPVISDDGIHTAKGGLMSYGPNRAEEYRAVASYVDRILRGAKPGDLPVQFPTSSQPVAPPASR